MAGFFLYPVVHIWYVEVPVQRCGSPAMRLLLKRIDQLNIGWNQRPLTEEHLFELCTRFDITVVEMPLQTSGFYYRLMGRDFIAVDSRLFGPRRLFVLFHEFAHFLFHTSDTGPAVGFHGVGRRTRTELEADVFALCAVLPRALIRARTVEDLVEQGFQRELVFERFQLSRRYGI